MPNMTAQTRALRVTQPLSWRRWEGVVADVWHARSDTGGGGYYRSPDPRLIVFLGGQAPEMGLRTRSDAPWQKGVGAFYIPAHMPLWSEAFSAQDYAHLDLHLQAGPLQQRLAEMGPHMLSRQAPLFLPQAESLTQIAALMAGQVSCPSRPDAMLDGLLSALLCEVFDLAQAPSAPPAKGGLPPATLRRIEDHVAAHLDVPLSIAQLAGVAGLSESWFPRAFRQSTGQTPARWISAKRAAEAARLMRESDLGLAQIAARCGFADQAHFSRVFRELHGAPPARWRQAQRGQGLGGNLQSAAV
ncbi:AraC family transcriptional regulator (plasmid) [Thioclava sp. 'Guangxiensis']|uniref:helix-turn-helix domain-containing protein n=1 Tax=Thioclava sp. 'Guangxiensis' TaxID=3149044 RepID=UPI003877D81D